MIDNLQHILKELQEANENRQKAYGDDFRTPAKFLLLLGCYSGELYQKAHYAIALLDNPTLCQDKQIKVALDLYRNKLIKLINLVLVMRKSLLSKEIKHSYLNKAATSFANLSAEITEERKAQHEKWGEQNHPIADWLMILGEEIGEANKHALEAKFVVREKDIDLEAYGVELIQIAAVGVAMIQSLERNELKQITI